MRLAGVIFFVAAACLLLVWEQLGPVRQLQGELDDLVEALCVELKWQNINRQILDIEVRALHGLPPDGSGVPGISDEHVIAIGTAINSIADQEYLSRLDCEP